MFKIFQYVYLLNKYIKCNIWRLALLYNIYIYIYVIRQLKVNNYNFSKALTIRSLIVVIKPKHVGAVLM